MSINFNHPDYIDLRSRLKEDPKDFVAIVGSGLSIPCGLPSWQDLKDKMIVDAYSRSSEIIDEAEEKAQTELIKKIEANRNLWQSFSALRNCLSDQAYKKNIAENLTIKNKDLIPRSYDLLWQLGIKGIITFNIDTCAIDSFSKVNRFAVDSATAGEFSRFGQFLTSPNQFVFQPHGTISDPKSWVFTNGELQALLNNTSYTTFMKTLMQTKNLLIVGFNPNDFAFTYLLQNALTDSSGTGPKHYIFLPNAESALIRELGDKGISVISYLPADPLLHVEIDEALTDMLAYLPTDDIPPSIYSGKAIDATALPEVSKLIQLPVSEMRDLLNSAILSIVPNDQQPSEDDLSKLDAFYRQNLRAIHLAWLIEPESECDILYDYKVLSSIGNGAFGKVYRAEHLESKENVAVKVLSPDVRKDLDYLNSFRRGVRSMRILTERKVDGMVRYRKAYEIPACVFMDFIEGPNLTQAMEWGFFNSITKCLEVLGKIGNIVHNAHNLAERVLHRDLKPDNVILKDCYEASVQAEVVVLDFDLSWHLGALDLTGAQAARSQGYAAPEQTAAGIKSGISIRHTAVDVFGLGMLAYYLFVGYDPRPNEQNFVDFKEKIESCIAKKNESEWMSLPIYLSDLVVGCTRDVQAERTAFSSAVASFEICYKMALSDTLESNHPLVLLEIAARLDAEGKFEVKDFGRIVVVTSVDRSKRVKLFLSNDRDAILIKLRISKVRAEHEHRHVLKYLPETRDKAISKLKKGGFKNVIGEIGTSRLDVYGDWYLPVSVTSLDIRKVSELLMEARSCLELR